MQYGFEAWVGDIDRETGLHFDRLTAVKIQMNLEKSVIVSQLIYLVKIPYRCIVSVYPLFNEDACAWEWSFMGHLSLE